MMCIELGGRELPCGEPFEIETAHPKGGVGEVGDTWSNLTVLQWYSLTGDGKWMLLRCVVVEYLLVLRFEAELN
jgi:hypothetical protein